MYTGVRRITFLKSLYWIIWRYLVKNDNKKWQTAPAIYITTPTGRPRIQRHALQLILAPDVNNTGHVALFVKPKKGNSWSFGRPKIGQVEKWCFLSIKMEKFSFAMKSIDESSFGCSLLALYNSNARTTKLTMRKPFWVHLCEFTFLDWQKKPHDPSRERLPPKSTVTRIFEFAVYLFR